MSFDWSGRTKTFNDGRPDHVFDVVVSDDKASELLELLIVNLLRDQYVSPHQMADLADAIKEAVINENERKAELLAS